MPMVAVPIWHGDLAQAYQLTNAIEHNCDCEQIHRRCSAHAAMLDQRFIDGILFARYLLPQLRRGEYRCKSQQLEAWRSLLDG